MTRCSLCPIQALGLGITFNELMAATILHPLVYRFAVFAGDFVKGGRSPSNQQAHRELSKQMPRHAFTQALACLLRSMDPALVRVNQDEDGVEWLDILESSFL